MARAQLDSGPGTGGAHGLVVVGLRDLLMGAALVTGLWLVVPLDTPQERLWQLILAGAGVLAVLSRRIMPITTTVVAAVATQVAWYFELTADPCILVGLCLYSVAEQRGTGVFPRRLFFGAGFLTLPAVGILTLLTVGLAPEAMRQEARLLLISTVTSIVVLAASWALGAKARQVRAEAAARARDEERLRLSREVHDVLSHSLSGIGVQAGVAAHVATLAESELRGALREIETDARSSLTELTTLLRRERGGLDEAPGAPLDASLAEYARRLERAGIRTDLTVRGGLELLPAAHEQTVRRLVQEATTNIVRHSEASRCRISIQRTARQITVEVCDDGGGAESSLREGHGLTGMRERADLLDGTFWAGNTGSGFGIVARLPLTAREAMA